MNGWGHRVHKMEALKNSKKSRSQTISIDFIHGQDWVQYLIWFPPLLPCTRPLLQLEHSKHPFVQLSPTLLMLGWDVSGWLGWTLFLDQKICDFVVKNPSTGKKNNTHVWISWIQFSFILHCNHNETYPGMLYQSIPINVATMSQPKTSKNSAKRRKSAAATKVCSLFRRRCSVSWPVRSSEPKIIFADSLESTALLTHSDCMLDLHMSSPQASKIGQRNLTLRNPQLRPFFVARIGLFAKQGNSRTASVSRVLSAQPEIHLSFNHRWRKYLEGRALQSPNTKHNMLVCSQLLFKLLVLLNSFLWQLLVWPSWSFVFSKQYFQDANIG